MTSPSSANQLPLQTPNTSAPIAQGEVNVGDDGSLLDGLGKPITGVLTIALSVTQSWRYLFGTFVQRSSTVPPNFSLTAGAGYSQSQLQALIDQVEALSKVVGST